MNLECFNTCQVLCAQCTQKNNHRKFPANSKFIKYSIHTRSLSLSLPLALPTADFRVWFNCFKFSRFWLEFVAICHGNADVDEYTSRCSAFVGLSVYRFSFDTTYTNRFQSEYFRLFLFLNFKCKSPESLIGLHFRFRFLGERIKYVRNIEMNIEREPKCDVIAQKWTTENR